MLNLTWYNVNILAASFLFLQPGISDFQRGMVMVVLFGLPGDMDTPQSVRTITFIGNVFPPELPNFRFFWIFCQDTEAFCHDL